MQAERMFLATLIGEGSQVGISEAELQKEIEALRCQLNEKAGDTYNKAKIQAAGPCSTRLDDLICRWHSIQAEKRESR